jgi:hypothetical protein
MAQKHSDTLVEKEPLPRELWQDLADLPAESHYLHESLQAANSLAQELGYKALTLDDIFPPTDTDPPDGYTSEKVVPNGLRFDATDLADRIPGFVPRGASMDVTVHKLVTDQGAELQYCDLRPYMSEAVQGSQIRPHNQGKVETAFYKDMKMLAEHGVGRKNVVEGVSGVYYSRAGARTKARRYWASITPEDNGPRTFAILGENPDDTNAQKAIYRQLFGLKM